jgi:hypothetical protein
MAREEIEIRKVKVWITTDEIVFLKSDGTSLSANLWVAYFNFRDSAYWGEQVKDRAGNALRFASERDARSAAIRAADTFLQSVDM